MAGSSKKTNQVNRSLSVSTTKLRPQSDINLVSATSREFDHKQRLNHGDRKLAQHYEAQVIQYVYNFKLYNIYAK